MLRNYLTIAYRHFVKERLYSFINVIGLAVGIACAFLIYLFVQDELSYDRHHPHADRIYRVNEFFEAADGSGERSSSLPFPMGETLAEEYSDLIEQSVRFFNFQAPFVALSYEPANKEFNERHFFFVDSAYHQVFDLPLVSGNPATALQEPGSVVISEDMAKKYFEGENPIGKTLRLQAQADLMITGVMRNMPGASHFHADFLASFSTLRQFYGGQIPNGWYWNPCWTYLLLRENANVADLEARLPQFVQKFLPEFIRNDVYLKIQALTDIHLTSHLEFEIEPNGSTANIYLFSGVAIFVLLIACINFMNLATARSVNRAREVGMRKTLGGKKHQLVTQFLLESVLMSFLAIVVGLVLVYVVLPWFNQLAGKALHVPFFQTDLLVLLVTTGLLVGLLAGIYPALVLTSFNAVKALKARNIQGKGVFFRKVLVVAQFAISIVLLIATAVVVQQLDFLQSDETGFQRDHIIMVPVIRTPMGRHYETIVEQAKQYPSIYSVTAVEEVLGAKHQGANYQFEGMEQSSLFSRLNVRHDFLATFNIPLLAGRDYLREVPTDDSLALVVNETLAKSFGWTAEEAVGKPYTFGRFQGRIVGVTEDFNFSSKHEPIGPLVMHLNTNPGAFNLFLKYMAVRINPQDVTGTIATLRQLWEKQMPERPFEYFFLDNELAHLYEAEQKLSRVAGAFSGLAVLVACLGLFGLASYNAEQRRKEISIRKVLGSSVFQVVALFFSDYVRLLATAIVIGCPVAYLLLQRWLETFAYRIDIDLSILIGASLLTVLVALLTVSYKSLSVARTNPAESLKSE